MVDNERLMREVVTTVRRDALIPTPDLGLVREDAYIRGLLADVEVAIAAERFIDARVIISEIQAHLDRCQTVSDRLVLATEVEHGKAR